MVNTELKKEVKNKANALFFVLVNKMKKWLKELYPYLIIVVVVILLKTFVVTPIVVNGPSMEPTLHENDVMLLDKISYRFKKIQRFDIVVVHHHDTHIIKRVIGLPGENIEYKDNKLYVDGKETEEPFEHDETDDFSLDQLDSGVVPEDSYLVLGDNRDDSLDSRVIGFIKKDQILGHAHFTIFPFQRFGGKD